MPEENKQTHAKEDHTGGSIVDTARANMSTKEVRKETARREREQKAEREDRPGAA